MAEQRDRPETIEVTPAMIEAGIGSLRAVDYESWESRDREECASFVTSIFMAMLLASKNGRT